MSVMKIRIRLAEEKEDVESALAIRRKVFQEERGISAEADLDGNDEAAIHFLLYCGNVAAGTARVRCLDGGDAALARIERVAVLPEFRSCGIGKMMMEHILHFLQQQKWVDKVELNAQESVKGFYEKIGFRQAGAPFEKAGALHVAMEMYLANF